jgi:hypothetical protein
MIPPQVWIGVYKPAARLSHWVEARLNFLVPKQEIGVLYQETYSLVVRWNYIRSMPLPSVVHGHAYMAISKGLAFESREHVPKSNYSVHDAGISGDQDLVKGLKELVFELSQSDKWVFYQGTMIFMRYVETHDPPCKHDGTMNQDEGGKDCSWAYKSVIGELNYLEKSARGNIAIRLHQCARYMSHTMRIHGEAASRIGGYLLGTHVRSDMQQSFECYVDAEYCAAQST